MFFAVPGLVVIAWALLPSHEQQPKQGGQRTRQKH
jgi:hypothetical protein